MDTFSEWAPIIGLLIFFIMFVVIAFRAYRPSAKAQLQAHATIPLKEDSHGR